MLDGSDKLAPLIIGPFKKPRCLRGVRSLPLPYTANRKAWMTSAVFTEWLQKLDGRMRKEKRNIVLFLDNCSAHVKAVQETRLSNVKVEWLIANSSCMT